jgi:hypothetical protein
MIVHRRVREANRIPSTGLTAPASGSNVGDNAIYHSATNNCTSAGLMIF